MDELDTYLFDRERRRRQDQRQRDVTILARDGTRLAGTLFEPKDMRRAVVIASATGVKRGYYTRFAEFLRDRGTCVLAFDYRGIGGSRIGSAADSPAAMHEWGELDLDAAIEWMILHAGVPRTHVIGHSVGGQLVGLVPDPERIRSIVMVASQSGDIRLWPAPARWRYELLFYGVVPTITHAMGYLPGWFGIGEDLPPGVALEWARWCRTEGYIDRKSGYPKVRAPILALGFDDDPYAPPAAIDALLDFYSSAEKVRRQIKGTRVGHFGFFRDRFRHSLWRDVQAWLDHFEAS